MDGVIEVAAQYPKVIFEHATGYKTEDNVGIYDGRGYQGWYVAGVVAGKMTKSNVLGYIAPYPIPEVTRNMNAFTLGARSVNPKAEVHPVWINAWVNPPKEREAAQALFDQGADVVARESDSNEPDKLAEELGKFVVGYNLDNSAIAPNAWLTAPIWDWGVLYTQLGAGVMEGKWSNTPIWWGFKEGLLKMAPFGKKVPADVQKMATDKQQEISDGTFDPFQGPINDNAGQTRVAKGVVMTDTAKLAFDWLVDGVKGTLPK
jgi:basic membrane protein A and related proteins